MSAPEERLRQLAEELRREGGTGAGDAAEEEETLVSRALQHLSAGDLHPTTVDLALSLPGEAHGDAAAEERGRARIADAMKVLRDGAPPAVGELLGRGRRQARVSEKEASGLLGLSVAALQRIEGGRAGVLFNQSPKRVAAYVRRIGVDARLFVAALFSASGPAAIYGYTPGVDDREREKALTAAGAEGRETQRRWVVTLLTEADKGEP